MSGKFSKKKKQQQHSERVRVVYVLSKGGLGMCEPNDFYLRVFLLWFDRKSIIPENFGFAITKLCRLRERGRTSKSVYVLVFNDLE